jgi:hypothetical protein
MFNLDQKISEWRRQMLAAGIEPGLLEELESHLRDELERQEAAGMIEAAAFENAVRQIGQPQVLKDEFAKATETISGRIRQLLHLWAGIPDRQLAMNMNIPNANGEPGWATYLKSGAYAIPGFFVWSAFLLFVVPKLKEICAAAGMQLWKPITMALNISDFVRLNFLILATGFFSALILLEWRSGRWPRYRRMVFGVVAYAINVITLIFMTMMAVLAVVAASHLLPAR